MATVHLKFRPGSKYGREMYRYDSAPLGSAARFEVYYDLGGYNIWGSNKKRGIYISITPVAIEEDHATYRVGPGGNNGGYVLLRELKRKSASALREAALFFDTKVVELGKLWHEDSVASMHELLAIATAYAELHPPLANAA